MLSQSNISYSQYSEIGAKDLEARVYSNHQNGLDGFDGIYSNMEFSLENFEALSTQFEQISIQLSESMEVDQITLDVEREKFSFIVKKTSFQDDEILKSLKENLSEFNVSISGYTDKWLIKN